MTWDKRMCTGKGEQTFTIRRHVQLTLSLEAFRPV
jgi:hypothetical protein